MKPFLYNKGQGLFEFLFDFSYVDDFLQLHQSTESKIRKSLTRPWTPFKGQLISKGLFGFFNSPKKRMKNICPSRLGQKLTFSSWLFGRIEDTKIFF